MSNHPLPRDVKKALDLLETDPARAWTVGKLAAACGVARRTLQKHFRRVVGQTPLEYLSEVRLARARQELLRAPRDVSVTEIATGCGFSHLGRFAARYRERYDESPSSTLRRCRNGVAGAPFLPLLPKPIERPALAVLPFDLVGPEARHAAGMAEEIAAALMRLRWIAVTAPGNAQYHLDAFGFEERAATCIASAIQPSLRHAEIDRAWCEDPARLSAWELTMRALPRVLLLDAAAERMALELLEQAMELAPRDALPIALAAWCHGLRGGHHFTARPDKEKAAARSLAVRAAQLSTGDPLTETMLAAGYTLAHDLATAAIHVDRALTLDGGSAWAWGRSGWIKAYGGEAAEAIERFQIARALAPGDPMDFLCSVGIAAGHFEAARYDKAAHWFARAIADNPAAVWINRALAPAYALAGRKEDARRSLAELTCAFPDLTIAQVRSGLPYRPSYLDRVAEGLERAGMRPS